MRLLLALLLPAALLSGTPPPPSPPPAQPASSAKGDTGKIHNTIRWKTASEVENLGFDIYRATVEGGPFDRITKKPIRGAGTSDEPHDYVHVDETIEAGKSYWYYVESISMNGAREKFTPTFKAPVKGIPPLPAATPGAVKAEPASPVKEKR